MSVSSVSEIDGDLVVDVVDYLFSHSDDVATSFATLTFAAWAPLPSCSSARVVPFGRGSDFDFDFDFDVELSETQSSSLACFESVACVSVVCARASRTTLFYPARRPTTSAGCASDCFEWMNE